MDLGVCIGQQRKVKEIINWVKKKKKRTICKDELISFLIGKQYTNTSSKLFNIFFKFLLWQFVSQKENHLKIDIIL